MGNIAYDAQFGKVNQHFVDLPAPLGPNKPNIPVGISRLTSFNAWFPFG